MGQFMLDVACGAIVGGLMPSRWPLSARLWTVVLLSFAVDQAMELRRARRRMREVEASLLRMAAILERGPGDHG